jgi:hypothetical protein
MVQQRFCLVLKFCGCRSFSTFCWLTIGFREKEDVLYLKYLCSCFRFCLALSFLEVGGPIFTTFDCDERSLNKFVLK